MNLGELLIALTVVMVAARAVGALAARFGQPRVVGEILAGVLIGPSALGRLGGPVATDQLFSADTRAIISALGQLGLLLYMLLVGARFHAGALRGRIPAVSAVTAAILIAPVAGGFLLLPVMFTERFTPSSSQIAVGVFLGAMLSVSAFPVMVRILEDRSLDGTALGSVAIMSAAVVTVMMFVLTELSVRIAESASLGSLSTMPLAVIAYLAVMLLGVRPVLARLGAYIATHHARHGASATLGLAIIVCLVSGYLAVQVGVGVIVGGFIAGVVLPYREVIAPLLAERLNDAVTVVLLPIFLASSGLVTDLGALEIAALPGLGALLIMALATKWGAGWAAARAVGFSSQESRALGVLLNCRGLLVLVVALAGLEAGVMTPTLQVGAVVVALITTAMTGPLFRRAMPDSPTPAVDEFTRR